MSKKESLSQRNANAAFSNPNATPAPTCAAPLQKNGGARLSGGADSYSCPICLDTIENAFMSKCGHSFCHQCISIHLVTSKTCPSCASPLQDGEIYPNFSLNNVISNSTDSPKHHKKSGTIANSDLSAFSASINLGGGDLASVAQDAASSLLGPKPGLREIDSMLLSLIEKRKQLESNEHKIQLELFSQFLQKCKQEKQKELELLKKTVACLDEDVLFVMAEIKKTQSPGNNNEATVKNIFTPHDSQNVPSTPKSIPAATASKRFAASSICSSPLPPSDLPTVVTPAGVNWKSGLTALTTGNISEVFTKTGRKRQHDEIDDSEDPSQPPLEFAASSISATNPSELQANHDPTLPLIKARMERIEPHFEDLQRNYLELRMNSPLFSPIPSVFPTSSSLSDSSDTLVRPNAQAHFPMNRSLFAESLSKFSTTSQFKTLARINYADKLVSGNGGSQTNAGGSGSGTGSSSIVSAIEFDRDDEYFATAGVTRKVKIYEFESVVKDWGEVFGGGPGSGGSSMSSRRRKGYIGRRSGFGSLFVTDSLRDETFDRFGDEGEDENIDNEDGDADGLFGVQKSELPDVVPRYPVLEMCGRSKISCLSWNSYIKNHLASSDYEGIVTLWDSNTGVAINEFEEHEKRTWSVDFNLVDPVLLASGSDDTKVKIWSTTQKAAVQTIESKANICSVKWNPSSNHQLAFGSADHNIHYYDLRKASEPLHLLTGHKKAVSYVKFLSKNELVSASTDSTLRLWDLGGSLPSYVGPAASSPGPVSPAPSSLFPPLSSFIKTNLSENILNSGIFRRSAASVLSLSSPVQQRRKSSTLNHMSPVPVESVGKPQLVRSYSGHQNEKNFVGLSINSTGEFISCGSENNTVYTYYNSLPKPAIVHSFGNGLDVINGQEVMDPEPAQFVSSVCWKRKSPDVLIAANSVGGVKVMQLI